MASGLPPARLRPQTRFDDPEFWTRDGFLVEAFGDGWALLSDPDTGEAWTVDEVVHVDDEGYVCPDGHRDRLAAAWMARIAH